MQQLKFKYFVVGELLYKVQVCQLYGKLIKEALAMGSADPEKKGKDHLLQ